MAAQTGSSCISDCAIDINTITIVEPMFPGMSKPATLQSTTYASNVIWWRKQEVIITDCVFDIKTIAKATSLFPWIDKPTTLDSTGT